MLQSIVKKLKVFDYLFLGLLLVTAVFVRTNNLEGKLTFEWDQARDYSAVSTMITTGKLPMLGPIVRGDAGGFYLGPLYYYLITPLYLFGQGNPLSLAVLSISADLLTIFLLYFLLRDKGRWFGAVLVATLWTFSPLIINNSYTAWNVTLIPLWVLAMLVLSTRLSHAFRFRDLWLFTLLASLTTNIHVSLFPLAALFLALQSRHFLSRRPIEYFKLFLAAVIPVSTLIIHDLTHSFENTILLKRFLFGTAVKSANLSEIVSLIIDKYGYTIGRLFTGEPYTYLGWLIVLLTVFLTLIARRHSKLLQASMLVIATILFSLLVYRDADFAEYYFIPTFIPLLLLVGTSVETLVSRLPKSLILILALAVLVVYFNLGLKVREQPISPYSLTVKKQLVHAISQLGYKVEFRTSLPRERNTGFEYLLREAGVVSDPTAPRKAYIYESKNQEVIAPEDARSIILDKPISAFKLIVFSN